jgi:nitrate reductase molybdenum cofactor assembly chaperone
MHTLTNPLLVADVLHYPDDTFRARLICTLESLEGAPLQYAVSFSEEVANVFPSGLEELYTQTFDLNPVATLEVGWHLWGEQYERGRFLADLRELQASLGIHAETELPDHLTVLLETIAKATPQKAAELSAQILPALEKILKPLDEHGNPYRHLIRAAMATLHASAPESKQGGAA